MRGGQHRGFTLIEVLVALAVVSVALFAGTQAISALTRLAQRQTDVLLAQLCSDNALYAIRLARQMPSVGENTQLCQQAGRSFLVVQQVSSTPNPSFVRVQIQVRSAEGGQNGGAEGPADGGRERGVGVLQVSTVVGRY